MIELRFVSREGEYLVLESADGGRFRVLADESLRDGVRKNHAPTRSTSPALIQQRIREGAGIDALVIETGESHELIEAFAAPILDEMRYLLDVALSIQFASGNSMVDFRALVETSWTDVEWSIRKQADNWILEASSHSELAAWNFSPKTLSLEPLGAPATMLIRTQTQPDYPKDAGWAPNLTQVRAQQIEAAAEPPARQASVLDLVEEIRSRNKSTFTAAVPADARDAPGTPPSAPEPPKAPDAPAGPSSSAVASKPASAKGRASLPSWDEIVLGAHNPQQHASLSEEADAGSNSDPDAN